MSHSDIVSLALFGSIAIAVIGLLVMLVVKASRESRKRYQAYQEKFKQLAERYSLGYGEFPFVRAPLPRVRGSVDGIEINYGIRYNTLRKTTGLEMHFWRNDLQHMFVQTGSDDFAYVLSDKIFGLRKNLAFGVYFNSFVPNNLRIDGRAVAPGFEERFQLAGESVETARRYLTEEVMNRIVHITSPETSRIPFTVLVYYDERGPAYGLLETDIIVRDMEVVDEIVELARTILK
jgi:hypothetical protein